MAINEAFLSDSQRAAISYTLQDQTFTGIPRLKHLWFVSFHSPIEALREPTRVFACRSIEKPKVEYGYETLNEYNKKRQIHTRIQYQPITVRFYDTVDNIAFNLWNQYSKYYFNDWNNKFNSNAWAYDQTSADYNQGPNNTDWGFNINNKPDASNSNFFDTIKIYQVYGGRYLEIDIVNPKIVSFVPDTLDYAAGNESQELTMTFAYEGIVIQPPQQITQDMVARFNLQISPFAPDIPGIGSLPLEARISGFDTNESFPASPFSLGTSDLINTAISLAGLAGGNPQSIFNSPVGQSLSNIITVQNAVNYQINTIGSSALNTFGNFSFSGLTNLDQNTLISQAFNPTFNFPSVGGNQGGPGLNLSGVNQNDTPFGPRVDISTGSTTSDAIMQAANIVQPAPIYSNPNNATVSASSATQIPSSLAVQLNTGIPTPDEPIPPLPKPTANTPNNFILSNLGTKNLTIASSQAQGNTKQLTPSTASVPTGTNPTGFYDPGVSGTLYDTQLGKIPGTSGNAPYAAAIAGSLTSAALSGAFSSGGQAAVNNLKGIHLNAIAVEAINSSRSPTGQIGYRSSYPNAPFAPYGNTYSNWNPTNETVNPTPNSNSNPYGIPAGQIAILPWQVYSPSGALISAETNNTKQVTVITK